MPQFQQIEIFPALVFWLAIIFGAMYYIMAQRIVPGIADVLEERAERIMGDISRADSLRAEAEAAVRAHDAVLERARTQARQIMGETTAEMEAEASSRLASMEADLDRREATATDSLERERRDALAELRAIARELATESAVRLAGIAPTTEEADRVVGQIMERQA